ncbi:hypothetical protein HHI36_007939, partial [Cryptolaemus montrouzieri]
MIMSSFLRRISKSHSRSNLKLRDGEVVDKNKPKSDSSDSFKDNKSGDIGNEQKGSDSTADETQTSE